MSTLSTIGVVPTTIGDENVTLAVIGPLTWRCIGCPLTGSMCRTVAPPSVVVAPV